MTRTWPSATGVTSPGNRRDAAEIRVSPPGGGLATGRLRMTTASQEDETPAWFVYTFRDRQIASIEAHLNREMA